MPAGLYVLPFIELCLNLSNSLSADILRLLTNNSINIVTCAIKGILIGRYNYSTVNIIQMKIMVTEKYVEQNRS